MTTEWLTGSGVYTVPVGVSSIDVTVVGAGSGGNGGTYYDTSYGGCGGGAGAIATATIAVSPGDHINFVVGVKGTAGLGVHTPHPVYGNGGRAGGQSYFGATVANGGSVADGCIKTWVVYYYGLGGANGPLAGGPGASNGGGTYCGAGGTGYGAGGGGGDGHNAGAGDGYAGGAGADGTIKLVYTAAVAPVASFTHGAEGVAPKTIAFTDTSTNTPTLWLWTWDDGTAPSTAQNPSHTFTSAGTFTVTLVASNAGGSDDYTHDIVMTAAPSAQFVAHPLNIHNGVYPAKVRFYNRSTGTTTKVTKYNWHFETSRTFTTAFGASPANERLLLTNANLYFVVDDRVTLISSGSPMDLPAGLSYDICYYVKAVTSTYFTLSLTSGGAAVLFTDNGTGTHKVGVGSVDENPVFTYADVGSNTAYDVTLTVIDAGSVTATLTKTGYIYHRTAVP